MTRPQPRFSSAQPLPPGQPQQPAGQFNFVHTVSFKGGWIGLFSGENQTKAIERAIRELNGRGLRICAATDDRWSFWKRLGMAILAVISLFFYVRSPNVILITEPVHLR